METKYVTDYYDKVYEKFPCLSKSDVRKIINYGLRQIHNLTMRGLHVLYRKSHHSEMVYFGSMSVADVEHKYYLNDLRKKVRYMWTRLGQPYDGYCYFVINKEKRFQYDEWRKTNDITKTEYNFGTVILHKNHDICKTLRGCVYRVPMRRNDYSESRTVENFCAKNVEQVVSFYETCLNKTYLTEYNAFKYM